MLRLAAASFALYQVAATDFALSVKDLSAATCHGSLGGVEPAKLTAKNDTSTEVHLKGTLGSVFQSPAKLAVSVQVGSMQSSNVIDLCADGAVDFPGQLGTVRWKGGTNKVCDLAKGSFDIPFKLLVKDSLTANVSISLNALEGARSFWELVNPQCVFYGQVKLAKGGGSWLV